MRSQSRPAPKSRWRAPKAVPEKVLRLNAALGPFLEMAISGVLSITLAEEDGLTVADVSYRVSGDAAHKLDTTIGAERFLHPIHQPD